VKVLIIDDEEDIRRIARLSLAAVGGMEVCEAGSGALAVSRARSERPDVVLLDMMMPGMDGISTFRALQNEPETADIPVVFLTAKALSAEVDRFKDLGARGVLVKPFDPMTLPRMLRELLDES
jgi:two-component system OmpR family response regulator